MLSVGAVNERAADCKHTTNVTCIQNGLAIALNKKHYSACTVVCIKKGNPDRKARSELDLRWSIQGNRPLLGLVC